MKKGALFRLWKINNILVHTTRVIDDFFIIFYVVVVVQLT